MKILCRFIVLLVMIVISGTVQTSAQSRYHNFNEMNATLKDLSRKNPELCKLESIVKTTAGNDIWVLKIGLNDAGSKPGIAVLGGIDGRYLLGNEIVTGFATKLLEKSGDPEISSLLDKVTFYLFPNVNPDATDQYFSNLKYERLVNGNPIDNDRDFKMNEDPYEDLNGDGMITLMRIKDPSGTHITQADDPRLMVEADLAKAEIGDWIVLSEGIDNDGDGSFNEDPEGGVNFNNNFAFEYEEFGRLAGINANSENETKAVADFLYDHFNIFAVFSYGPQDNLGKPFKAKESKEGSGGSESSEVSRGRRGRGPGKITKILKEDEMLNKLLSEKYHKITGLSGSPGFTREAGNFMEWAYYHYGRYSYSTPGWWIPNEKEPSKEASLLKFIADNAYEGVFIPWEKFDHPDFPGKLVEIGGISPFALTTPPIELLDSIIESNYLFIIDAAKMHPSLELLDLNVEKLDNNIFRITVKVHNKGVFSTSSKLGEAVKWVRKMRIELKSDNEFSLLSGRAIESFARLNGDETREKSWLVMGKGKYSIIAGAVNSGTAEISFELK
jgi:hypothetical protein